MVEEGYITHGAGPGRDEAPGHRRRTTARARPGGLLRRARPAGARGSLRRRRHLRDRPAGGHHSRRAVGTGRRDRARPRSAAHRQAAPPLPEADPQPRTRRHGVAAGPARGPARRRHRARRGGPDLRRPAVEPDTGPRRRARGGAAARRLRLDARQVAAGRCSSVGDVVEVAVGSVEDGVPGRPDARAAADHRGRGGGAGQPHRADSRAGRRPELRPQQVQSRHPGAAPGRIAVQADRLRDLARPGPHRGIDLRRRAGVLRRRPQPAAVRAAQLRPEVRRPGHPAPRARAVAEHSGGQGARGRGAGLPSSRWPSASA